MLHRLDFDGLCRLTAAVASMDRQWKQEKAQNPTLAQRHASTSHSPPSSSSLSGNFPPPSAEPPDQGDAPLRGGSGSSGGRRGHPASLVPGAWADQALVVIEQRLQHFMKGQLVPQGSPISLAPPPLSAKQLLQLTWALAAVPLLRPKRPLRGLLLAAAKALLDGAAPSWLRRQPLGDLSTSGRGAFGGVTLDQLSQLPLRLAVAGVARDNDKCGFFHALMSSGNKVALQSMTDPQVGGGRQWGR